MPRPGALLALLATLTACASAAAPKTPKAPKAAPWWLPPTGAASASAAAGGAAASANCGSSLLRGSTATASVADPASGAALAATCGAVVGDGLGGKTEDASTTVRQPALHALSSAHTLLFKLLLPLQRCKPTWKFG